MDQIPTKKHNRGVFGIAYPGGDRSHLKKYLNLNIYKSKNMMMTKDDDNYERRVGMKELIFYMQRDPLLKKSKACYQTLVRKFWTLNSLHHLP